MRSREERSVKKKTKREVLYLQKKCADVQDNEHGDKPWYWVEHQKKFCIAGLPAPCYCTFYLVCEDFKAWRMNLTVFDLPVEVFWQD